MQALRELGADMEMFEKALEMRKGISPKVVG